MENSPKIIWPLSRINLEELLRLRVLARSVEWAKNLASMPQYPVPK
jgi:hypothetical protein